MNCWKASPRNGWHNDLRNSHQTIEIGLIEYKKRKNLIDEAIEPELFDYLGGVCKGLECYPVQVGGYRNHIHFLYIDINSNSFVLIIDPDTVTINRYWRYETIPINCSCRQLLFIYFGVHI